MEIIISIVEWLFLNSIYGIAIIVGIVYLFALGIKKIIPIFPNPFLISAIAFIIAISTFPSIPRYKFEKNSLSLIEGKEWIRVINKTNWGSITEPLTWFNAPIGSLFIIMPNDPTIGGYREVLLRYGYEEQVMMTDPDCLDQTISYSEPDSEGIFRYTSEKPQVMNKEEISIYCDYDWSKENKALRKEILKQPGSD